MAERQVKIERELGERPILVDRENVIMNDIGNITGVFPEGTLEITENGVYGVTTKENVNVQIPEDPAKFINFEVDRGISTIDSQFKFLTELLKVDSLIFNIAEGVTAFSIQNATRQPITSLADGRSLKLTGGSNVLVNIGNVASLSSPYGASELDLSELTLAEGCSAYGVCANNIKITKAKLPLQEVKISSLRGGFSGCTNLKEIDFGGVLVDSSNYTNGYQVFVNASSLERVIFRNDTEVAWFNNNSFSGSAIAAGTCLIYVPDNLVDAYKTDTLTGWRNYADQIKPLSELPEE